jgi:hypothetical protein
MTKKTKIFIIVGVIFAAIPLLYHRFCFLYDFRVCADVSKQVYRTGQKRTAETSGKLLR